MCKELWYLQKHQLNFQALPKFHGSEKQESSLRDRNSLPQNCEEHLAQQRIIFSQQLSNIIAAVNHHFQSAWPGGRRTHLGRLLTHRPSFLSLPAKSEHPWPDGRCLEWRAGSDLGSNFCKLAGYRSSKKKRKRSSLWKVCRESGKSENSCDALSKVLLRV